MISKLNSLEYKLGDGKRTIGNILVSKNIKSIESYRMPFSKKDKLEIVKIGSGSYENFDSFIIASLNDYFTKLSNPSDVETKEKMLEKYTQLYNIWSNICQKKETNDIVSIQDDYDKISYGLYLLGYIDSNL